MLLARPTTALASGALAAWALHQAVRPVQLVGVAPLAASALWLSLAMAALAVTGALLLRPRVALTLGLKPSTLSPLRTSAFAVGLVGMSQLLNTLLVASGLHDPNEMAEIDRVVAAASGSEYALLLVACALAPAIAEEALFRGLILRGMIPALGPTMAVLSSSLLFGLAHLDGPRGAGAALLGLYLGAIALKAGSIRSCIVCHLANNVAGVSWWLVMPAADQLSNELEAIVPAASAAATAVGLIALVTTKRPEDA